MSILLIFNNLEGGGAAEEQIQEPLGVEEQTAEQQQVSDSLYEADLMMNLPNC